MAKVAALLADKAHKAHNFSWFALAPGYGSAANYGPIISTWAIRDRPLQLLNLSTYCSPN